MSQGVHVLDFHDLERLAADRGHEFARVAATDAIRGSAAGSALRSMALR